MTSTADRAEADAVGRERLAQASEQLRGRPHRRAVEIADDVLTAALRSSRRSLPVRARPAHGRVYVGEHVLISRLRQRIDDEVPRCSVGRIFLLVDPRSTLREVTIELYVQYGEVLMDVADLVRGTAVEVLDEVLGSATRHDVGIAVTHVHVSDVTVADPHLVDPGDETL